jgi:hypothetical protein
VRSFLLSIVAILLLLPTWSGEERIPLYDGTPDVSVTPVPLVEGEPKRRQVGALTYLGGVRLKSGHPAFGGFSALAVQGNRVLLLSDFALTFAFTMDGDLRPRDFAFGALPAGPRGGWSRIDRDSESMAVDPRTGSIWTGFENANAIWRYTPGFARLAGSASPAPMADWPKNGGAEAIVRLRSGRFLVFAESERVEGKPGTREVLVFDRDPTDPRARSFAFAYRPPARFDPTDAAELPDGRLLVLHRRASVPAGFTAVLTILDSRSIAPGATLSGREIARFEAPVIHDNFEGLAVTREGASTIVWIASDDNAPTWWQRSLLLKFRLDG